MTVRMNDVLFYAGGECLQKFGVPVWRSDGRQATYSATRSGAVGPIGGKDGRLRGASANRVRVEWLDLDGDGVLDTPALLFEPARTNLVTSDDVSAWSVSGTPLITGSVDDPRGGTGAYTVEDNDGATWEYPFRNVVLTGGAGITRCAVFVVRRRTVPANGYALNFGTAAFTRGQIRISSWPAGGAPVAATGASGVFLGQRPAGNGYWALYLRTNNLVDSGETNRLEVRPAFSNTQQGSIDIFRANAFDTDVPGFSILDASETREADAFNFPIGFPARELTVYLKMYEWGTIDISSGPVFHIGSSTITSAQRLTIQRGTTRYQAVFGHPDGNVVEELSTGTPAYGQVVEFLLHLSSAGIEGFSQSISGGAPATGSEPVARSLGDWAGKLVHLNGPPTFAVGTNPIISLKGVAGGASWDDMRSLFA